MTKIAASTDRKMTKILLGRVYEFDGERLEVCTIVDGSECIVQKFGTKERFSLSLLELSEGSFKPKSIDELTGISKEAWDRGNNIRKAIQKVLSDGPITDKKLREVGASLKPALGLRMMHTYLARFIANPSTTSCVSLKRGPRRGEHRLKPQVEFVISSVIAKAIGNQEATSLSQINSDVKTSCENQNLPIPSKDTVYRRLITAGVSLRRRKRLGPSRYRESIVPLTGSHTVEYPGAEYQIDHTLMDLMVLDESRRYCLGRFWITLVIDIFSRCIPGFFLGFMPPSMASVQRALSLAVSNKSRALSLWGFDEFEWPMQGIPKSILSDHGREFKSHAYLRGCEEHGIQTRWRLKKSYGGHIERLIGTMMGRLHLLPGTTFSNVPKRIGYQPEARAVMTGAETLRFIVSSICEYHETRHSALGITPRMKWEEGQAFVPPGVLKVAPMPKFFQDFLPEFRTGRQSDGIHWGGYRYNSRVLSPIAVKKKVSYRIDPLDTSRALVQMPNGAFVEVPRATPVTYNIHALEKQLRSVKAAGCFASEIVARREAAAAERRTILATAKTKTQAASNQHLAFETVNKVKEKCNSIYNDKQCELLSPTMINGDVENDGECVLPSIIYSSSKL